MDRADELAVHVLRYAPETHGATALAADGDDRGVVALVMQGVDVNGFDDGGATPLIAACGHGRLAVVRRLLAHRDVAVDLAGKRGVTPLMHAAAAGFDDGVLALLRKGADRRKRTDQGRRAADYAAEHGHVAFCVEINRWFGGSPPNFRTLYLNQIDVDSADFWTDRLLSSSFRSTAKESGPNRSITRTLKSG